MTQVARPIADTFLGNYLDELGAAIDIFQSIDDVVVDDGDFIKSPVDPNLEVYVTKLTSLSAPAAGANTLTVRHRKTPSTADQLDAIYELREGYVDEATQGTLLGGVTVVDVPDVFTDVVIDIEPSGISDYTDLFLRVVADQQ